MFRTYTSQLVCAVNQLTGFFMTRTFPYLFKVNNRNTEGMCEIYSKVTIKTPEKRNLLRPVAYILNFEVILHIVLVFPLLTLSKQIPHGFALHALTKSTTLWSLLYSQLILTCLK